MLALRILPNRFRCKNNTLQKCKDIKCNIYLKITLTEAYSSPIPSASTSDQVDYADTEDKGSGKVEVTADKTHVTAP